METLAKYDIIWETQASKSTVELKRMHLNQVIEAQKEIKSGRWFSKENKAHARKVLKLAQAELDKLNKVSKKEQ